MGTIEELKKVSQNVVRHLRKQKLDGGKPFMFWTKSLPKDQSYMEYPDSNIKIVTVAADLRTFIIVKELPLAQAQLIRQELNLV